MAKPSECDACGKKDDLLICPSCGRYLCDDCLPGGRGTECLDCAEAGVGDDR